MVIPLGPLYQDLNLPARFVYVEREAPDVELLLLATAQLEHRIADIDSNSLHLVQ